MRGFSDVVGDCHLVAYGCFSLYEFSYSFIELWLIIIERYLLGTGLAEFATAIVSYIRDVCLSCFQ